MGTGRRGLEPGQQAGERRLGQGQFNPAASTASITPPASITPTTGTDPAAGTLSTVADTDTVSSTTTNSTADTTNRCIVATSPATVAVAVGPASTGAVAVGSTGTVAELAFHYDHAGA
jgi:hypothetical protein